MNTHIPILATLLILLPLSSTHAQSQMQMNREAGQALEKADTKLNTIYKKIMASKDVEAEAKKNLRIAQRAWLQFVEAQINTIFPVKKGENPRELYGSMYALDYASTKTELLKNRIQQLEQILPQDATGSSNKAALKELGQARKDVQAAYRRLLKLHYEDPGMEQVVQQAQEAWEKYAKAQLISQFPLREEEEKMPEAIYGSTYYPDHAKAEIKLIRQRIAVLVAALQ